MASYRSSRPFWQSYDWKLVFIYIALIVFGLINIPYTEVKISACWISA